MPLDREKGVAGRRSGEAGPQPDTSDARTRPGRRGDGAHRDRTALAVLLSPGGGAEPIDQVAFNRLDVLALRPGLTPEERVLHQRGSVIELLTASWWAKMAFTWPSPSKSRKASPSGGEFSISLLKPSPRMQDALPPACAEAQRNSVSCVSALSCDDYIAILESGDAGPAADHPCHAEFHGILAACDESTMTSVSRRCV